VALPYLTLAAFSIVELPFEFFPNKGIESVFIIALPQWSVSGTL